ncbi:S8 family serine peptidase [Archangium violaceum]|uniref:S8 family serine peptidase n=1 Tax=Archangium violaceum TaxID=83451 RepID=UPI00193C7BEA|nr:S8 family serine peptidase [Archangium violaceum]QRK05921.1 S8 family serine peptidase [Archangium violaceum]
MKLKLTQTLFTCSVLGLSACGEPMAEQDQVIESKDVGQLAQLLRSPNAVPDQYIVVFHDTQKDVARRGPAAIAQEMASAHGGQVLHTYSAALKGFAVRLPAARLQRLLEDPRVAYVEEDGFVQASASQSNATWGIDRTDQRALPLNSTYSYNADGTGVHAYIVDTGVKLTHTEFTGRMGNGYDAVTSGGTANDCNGHGTHVAGSTAGTTYGIAKKATVHPVRVLDCNGSGTNAGVIAGVDWVTANHVKPAVANMSLGGGASSTLDNAVTNSVNAGVVYAVAAGNDNKDACNYSPARAAAALTVGSTASNDSRSSFSNFGSCVDIFAPGSSITSAWYTSDTATNTISGTSMASPHVAGVAALYLQCNPGATPSQVEAALEGNATSGVLTSIGSGSPNLLLYSSFISCGGGGGDDTTAPTTSISSPTSGSTVSGTTTISASASDNVGVSKVEFYAGSSLLGTDTSSPYGLDWNTTTVADGTYSLTTKAYDAAGNVATSSAVSVNVSNSTGSCSISEQLLLNPGFESGNVSWVADSGVIGTTTNSRTGSYSAWHNGYASSNTDYSYQDVTIPSGACSASLSFWLRIDTAETTTTKAYDKFTVTVRNTSNSVLATLASYSNLNKTGYVQKSFDLKAYAGKTVRIYFYGTEDSSLATSFFIDDAALTITR